MIKNIAVALVLIIFFVVLVVFKKDITAPVTIIGNIYCKQLLLKFDHERNSGHVEKAKKLKLEYDKCVEKHNAITK